MSVSALVLRGFCLSLLLMPAAGVQQAARLLRGEAVGPRQARLAALYVNQTNLEQPAVRQLLPKQQP